MSYSITLLHSMFCRSLRKLLFLAFLPIVAIADAEPVRIVPIGDSITQGGKSGREEYTYRYPLFRMLREAGVEFDFIGSRQAGLDANATWPDVDGVAFDRDHEGYYGWKTGAVRRKLAETMSKWSAIPDIALIHLGTNDQKAEDYKTAIAEELEAMIQMLREKNPRIAVLIGHLNFNGGAALKIRPIVEAMAQRLDSPESPVKTVHHYQGWTEDPKKPGTDTFDWAHPNPKGQEKMARKWFEAMQPYLKK